MLKYRVVHWLMGDAVLLRRSNDSVSNIKHYRAVLLVSLITPEFSICPSKTTILIRLILLDCLFYCETKAETLVVFTE